VEVPYSANDRDAPNAVLSVSNYTVNMDIDRLYAQSMSCQPAGFGVPAQGAGVPILYRVVAPTIYLLLTTLSRGSYNSALDCGA